MDELRCETALSKVVSLVDKLAMLDVSLCEVDMCLVRSVGEERVRWGQSMMLSGCDSFQWLAPD